MVRAKAALGSHSDWLGCCRDSYSNLDWTFVQSAKLDPWLQRRNICIFEAFLAETFTDNHLHFPNTFPLHDWWSKYQGSEIYISAAKSRCTSCDDSYLWSLTLRSSAARGLPRSPAGYNYLFLQLSTRTTAFEDHHKCPANNCKSHSPKVVTPFSPNATPT
ncbi:hypothetical protein B0H12DRAFT_833773 [Mycena haematopus]|nr:hypothetical protein B0H12DRAFT_833773 [Mycena haematopus]